ncbi:hypothetical protein U9M48_012090 [Paspalum notatum var. saurae]|uniref:F-box/LRR-repeat protein 15/At3g58940/PEG3-like LRR domain-containing protein n=1 Tax=Paspalum notatum var. saurae TaxID=547442 RepID=A0AAQ3SXK4_PASNO
MEDLDGWLRCPALDNHQELVFHCRGLQLRGPPPLLPALAHRASSTLRVATFDGCRFPDGADANALRSPVLEKLSLSGVTISEISLHALLAGCPVLQILILSTSSGFTRLRLVSPCLRSIGVQVDYWARRSNKLQLVIEDAPCLDMLLLFAAADNLELDIVVISELSDGFPRLKFDTVEFQVHLFFTVLSPFA